MVRALVQALIGQWAEPSLTPSKLWVFWFVVIAAFAVLGLPTVVGTAVAWTLGGVEDRLRWDLETALKSRDEAFKLALLGAIRDSEQFKGIQDRGITLSSLDAAVESAVDRAAAEWRHYLSG